MAILLVILPCALFLHQRPIPVEEWERPTSEWEVEVVYFINTHVNPDTYHHLLISQLSDLVSIQGLPPRIHHLWIECCGTDPHHVVQRYIDKAMGDKELRSRTTLTMHKENNHEYFGIHRVWSLSHRTASRYLLYFHTKGITRKKFTKNDARDSMGTQLINTVIRPWKKVVTIFHDHPLIDKIGYSFSREGWIWYNFWWIRASYCRQLEEPAPTENRYYYEEYIARKPRFQQPSNRPLSDTYYHLSHENCWGLKIPEVFSPV